jgi:hypothetical protein
MVMRLHTLAILLGVSLVCTAGVHAAGVHVLSDRPLPAPAAYALDVRWATDQSVYITAYNEGILEVPTGDLKAKTIIPPVGGRCKSCVRLGLSDAYLVTAFPAFAVVWKKHDRPESHQLAFDTTVDLDVHDDRLLLLGSRREKGKWAPDGAIGWTGTLSSGLADLEPVLFSQQGPKAQVFGKCGFLDHGGARFFPDGSFVLVPGAEPGVYLYDHRGRLSYTWQTNKLNIFDRCNLPQDQLLLYMRDPEARAKWLTRVRTVDDVLALPEGPGLVVREVKGGKTIWSLILLRRDKPTIVTPLPFSEATDVASVKADVRGRQIVFLVNRSARWRNDNKPSPGRLILAEWR